MQEGASPEGEMGLSMSPPAFALHASKPIQRQVGGGQTTNYRVDTARLTMQDLDDPEIRAWLEGMSAPELLDLAGRVQDPDLALWLRRRGERGRAGRIESPSPFVSTGHEEEYQRLVALLQSVAAAAPEIVANPPAAQAVLRGNPNAQMALEGIRRAAQVIASRSITTVFNPLLPANVGAKYESVSNTMSVRPFGNDRAGLIDVALNVVHELTHQAQDQALERSVLESGMQRFGRREDLARERGAWTVGTYSYLIFQALGHTGTFEANVEYNMMLAPMEQDRLNPRGGHQAVDRELTGDSQHDQRYRDQFRENDHIVMYRIVITEDNLAVLSHPQGETTLGEVPSTVTLAGPLVGYLSPLVERLPNYRALYRARHPRETFRKAFFIVFSGTRRIIEFGLRNPDLPPDPAPTAAGAGANGGGATPAARP